MKINIDQELKKIATQKVKPKKDQINRLEVRVPDIRKHVKKNYHYNENEVKTQLKTWDEIWNKTPYFESMSSALYFYQHRTLKKSEVDTLKKWIKRCDCWEHSDDLSKIYAQVLEENPKWILPTLKRWNKSKNPWERRQSVVSLLEYASKRKKVLPFKELISFIKPLLNDDEYYVQKGIGWSLREIYNVYPKQTLDFFKKNLLEIKPLAYSAATEKLDKKIKAEFNKKRASNRGPQ